LWINWSTKANLGDQFAQELSMNKFLSALAIGLLASSMPALADTTAHPEKMSKADIGGAIFSRPDMLELTDDGNTTQDVTSFLSSDGKFGSGMYKSGAIRAEISEPYGVDEFMYFLEGSVTLTSSDGTVQVINAGEAVTIPKEWTGIWETEGYTKIWVIYTEDGSGLE
jgi:uncharacterized cupin superfamily protein